ncbi:aminopeptidase P family protein [Candidatus Tokpelaia sp.]|uniref:aminopeptidase P family protein n=1 Tax=Candidatus Tokpelaia sp. TaxID=2233777 RepID=UPI001238B03F|nr:aminopeptidase P family protein [Candidatus Tokpelaia sp.]KAA6405883.1 aminopeptidase P family protein [Candidatus Tokpelaia sp.]
MFQSFTTETNPQQAGDRLSALRQIMKQQGFDAFLVPHNDEYQGEYVPPCAQRLAWLTGFDGSAGYAVILPETAVLFVDGRYKLQARQQTDPALFTYEDLIATPPAAWLRHYSASRAQAGSLPAAGLKIGFDPWLHSIKEAAALREALAPQGELTAAPENLIDLIWQDRPPAPQGRVTLQPAEYTGRSAADKLAAIRAEVKKAGAGACLLTEPAAIAWALNIRGSDVAHTPVALGFALIPVDDSAPPAGKAVVFIDEAKCDAAIEEALAPVAMMVPIGSLSDYMASYIKHYSTIMLDIAGCAEAFRLLVEEAGGQVIAADDPAELPRAVKTAAELAGARQAHLRDGVAMVRFLAWLDAAATKNNSDLDEITAAEKLEAFRRDTAAAMGSRLEDISFDTISGIGANGAIIHYRVTEGSNRQFQQGELYLTDSGGQYRDGTTDITRTVAIGTVGEEEKRCFTLVLQGLINLSRARFPQGTRGRDLDSLARYALWQNGMDYAHGTGHGIGSFLNVHEGPQTISRAGAQELYAGMIISCEPGYYCEGAFGIRLENLLIISPASAIPGGDTPMLSFETLTLCPMDNRLVLAAMLSAEELAWLNAYHAHVRKTLRPFITDSSTQQWLKQATAEIAAQ